MRIGRKGVFEWNVGVSLFITITFAVLIATHPYHIKLIEHIPKVSGLAQKRISCNCCAAARVSDIFCIAVKTSLFNFFWLVEKHDVNPANTGMLGLVESVKSVLICG